MFLGFCVHQPHWLTNLIVFVVYSQTHNMQIFSMSVLVPSTESAIRALG